MARARLLATSRSTGASCAWQGTHTDAARRLPAVVDAACLPEVVRVRRARLADGLAAARAAYCDLAEGPARAGSTNASSPT